jgi:hypothetical protein
MFVTGRRSRREHGSRVLRVEEASRARFLLSADPVHQHQRPSGHLHQRGRPQRRDLSREDRVAGQRDVRSRHQAAIRHEELSSSHAPLFPRNAGKTASHSVLDIIILLQSQALFFLTTSVTRTTLINMFSKSAVVP